MFNDAGQRTTDAILGIWRETSNNPKIYERINEISLGTCGGQVPAPLVMGMSDVYECTLPQSERVSVQPGDVIGIEIARNSRYRFRLYFDDTNSGPTNYVFNGQVSTATLNQASFIKQDHPQISLTIEPIISTTVPLTTRPLTTTQASTTDLPTTQLPTTTTEPEDLSTAATPQPLTTTRASTTTEVTIIGTEFTTGSATETQTTDDAQTTKTPATSTADVPSPATTNLATTTGGPLLTDNSTIRETFTTTAAPATVEDSDSTIVTISETTADTANAGGVVEQKSFNIGTLAGAVVSGIIAILLVLIIIILLVLVLRRRRSGQKFTPPTSTIVNTGYDGKPQIVLNVDEVSAFPVYYI